MVRACAFGGAAARPLRRLGADLVALCAACTPEGEAVPLCATRTASVSTAALKPPRVAAPSPTQAGLYLVVVTADRKVDMKVLAGKLGLSGTNFRFADEAA